jgi:hypothetical protein
MSTATGQHVAVVDVTAALELVELLLTELGRLYELRRAERPALDAARVLARHLHAHDGWHPRHLGACQAARCPLPINLVSGLQAAIELLDRAEQTSRGGEDQ